MLYYYYSTNFSDALVNWSIPITALLHIRKETELISGKMTGGNKLIFHLIYSV